MTDFHTPYKHGESIDNHVVEIGAIILDELSMLSAIVKQAEKAIADNRINKFINIIVKANIKLVDIKCFIAEVKLGA